MSLRQDQARHARLADSELCRQCVIPLRVDATPMASRLKSINQGHKAEQDILQALRLTRQGRS